MPRVSVVIPAYNAARTLWDTLESARSQTWSDFEVWVIDDGSTDDTAAIAERFANGAGTDGAGDRRFRLARYPNGNQARSRNRGIERASGEYVAFLDADDLWTPDKLACQVQALDAQPDVGLVYSWTDCIDEGGQFVRPGSHVTAVGDVYRRLLGQNFLDNGSSPMVRRSVLDAVGGFDPSLPPVEDWDLWLRIAARYPFAAIPWPQVLYRVSIYSSSANPVRLERSCRRAIALAFERAPAEWQGLKGRSLANLYEYLYFQTFSGAIRRRQVPKAFGYLLQALRYDPALRRDRPLVRKALLKIALMATLPNAIATALLWKLDGAAQAHGDVLSYIRAEDLH